MAELGEQTGEGLPCDTDNNAPAMTVAYRIVSGSTVGRDETTWGGEPVFRVEDEEPGPGL